MDVIFIFPKARICFDAKDLFLLSACADLFAFGLFNGEKKLTIEVSPWSMSVLLIYMYN